MATQHYLKNQYHGNNGWLEIKNSEIRSEFNNNLLQEFYNLIINI